MRLVAEAATPENVAAVAEAQWGAASLAMVLLVFAVFAFVGRYV